MRRYWWVPCVVVWCLLVGKCFMLAREVNEARTDEVVSHGRAQNSLDSLSTAWYDLVDRVEGAEEELRIAEREAQGWQDMFHRAITNNESCGPCVEWHSLNHPRLGSKPTALTRNEEAHFWKVNSDAHQKGAEQWERTAMRWRARALGEEDTLAGIWPCAREGATCQNALRAEQLGIIVGTPLAQIQEAIFGDGGNSAICLNEEE